MIKNDWAGWVFFEKLCISRWSKCCWTSCAKEQVDCYQLMFVGVEMEAEGKDRASLDLPGHQHDLLRDAYTYGKTYTLCSSYSTTVFFMKEKHKKI